MKICIINNLYPPYSRGGAEHLVFRTVKGMLELGHEVIVITTSPDGFGLFEEGKLKIYRYKPKNLFFYTKAHKYNWFMRLLWHIVDTFHISSSNFVKKILKEEKPDVVHTHNLMGMSFLIPRAIRRLSLRHLHTVHDVQLVEPSGIILKSMEKSFRYTGFPTKIYTWVIKKLMGSPDVVISPSQFLLDFYTNRGFFKNSKRVMLRNPVSVEESDRATRHSYNHLRFLYLGQIEEHKGVIFLVDTFLEICRDNDFEAELHIAGDGSQFKRLKDISDGYDNIIFHGKVDRIELPKLFEQTSMTIVPSLCYENSPTVIFESLSFGVPVLASRVEGIAELIKEGENGITFETGNKESLKEKLAWSLNNKEELEEMGEKTKKSLVGLSHEDYIEKLYNLYVDATEEL